MPLIIGQHFHKGEGSAYQDIARSRRRAEITASDGRVVFEQDDVEAPRDWSGRAVNIAASKYFRGKQGTPERETSVIDLIMRVSGTIARWGLEDGYFKDIDANNFENELAWLQLHQYAAFNSPVYFNVGIDEQPQASACFILGVEDNMESILGTVVTEGMLFKGGSGSGTNLSSLRSSRERLSSGGQPSGPISFMRGYDAFAGVIKSGGKTRRAACMRILDDWHPDINEFIQSKASEEKKAQALIDAGYSAEDAYASVSFQNANNSVRLSDFFMHAVESNAEWWTNEVTGNHGAVSQHMARNIFRKIAQAAWECGDPGVQFTHNINKWHTCPHLGEIRGSNPCSEFMWVDNSSCNLASLNLAKFVDQDGYFDPVAFTHAVCILITAQEIIVGRAAYPTAEIEDVAKRDRPLGLGYANLGGMLMAACIPYDSPQGRHYAAAITALMTGAAYYQSAVIARDCGGPHQSYRFSSFEPVFNQHWDAVKRISTSGSVPVQMTKDAAANLFSGAHQIALARGHGVRNSQVTLIAPTGTTGLMMDCDTTGIEPAISLISHKTLVGGGTMKLTLNCAGRALKSLGHYHPDVLSYIEEHNTLAGYSSISPDHLPIFETALGKQAIGVEGHLGMMAAVQPFLSGAISKTVNLPNSATVEDVENTFMSAWKMGLKAVAIYRDGSKRMQPLTTKKDDTLPAKAVAKADTVEIVAPMRLKLPDTREAITHKFSISGHEGYLTVGLYNDGSPGELFLTMNKAGSTLNGMLDAFAIVVSHALQYGVPLKALCDKLTHIRFDPSGITQNSDIRFAKSIIDYVFRWLEREFLVKPYVEKESAPVKNEAIQQPVANKTAHDDAPPCNVCGSLMVRAGTCYSCPACGETSGCS